MGAIVAIVVCLLLAVGIPVISLINLKLKEEHNFRCTECLHEYSITENELHSFRSFGRLYVKCPKCEKYCIAKFVRK